jgi:heterodisulfide reductase subunit B
MVGVELCELPDWSCCGASSAHVTDKSLALDLAARNLAIAEKQAMDLVIPCAACYGRIKAAEKEMPARRRTAAPEPGLRVLNLLDFIVTAGLSEKIVASKKRTLNGLKVVCYYGCLFVRPPKLTGAKDHENPREMDRLLALIGAEPIPWSHKTDCCGGSLVITRTDIVRRLTQKLFEGALRAGAEAIVVACPLCQSNLDSREEEISREAGKNYDLPVLYFTELIGLALGHRDAGKWFKRHFIDPAKLLAAKGLV